MRRIILSLLIFFLLVTGMLAKVKVRLKNVTHIKGLKANQLIGYGVVTGLSGTGDSKKFKVTHQMMSLIMENLGIDTENDIIESKNSALVIITARIPSNIQQGDVVDVEVSSIGDARSIVGGVLLQAPLKASDGTIYAVAQGAVTVSDTEGKNKTSGIIPAGAIVEKDVNSSFINNNKIILILNYPDFNLVNQIKQVITETVKADISVLNNKAIEITIPDEFKDNVDKFISEMENLEVEPEPKARIVINKNSGVVVISGDVRLSEAAVTYKNVDVYIKKRGTMQSKETEDKQIFHLEESSDVKSVIDGLNKIGAKTEDIIAILHALKKANALYGEIIVE